MTSPVDFENIHSLRSTLLLVYWSNRCFLSFRENRNQELIFRTFTVQVIKVTCYPRVVTVYEHNLFKKQGMAFLNHYAALL